MHKAENYFCDLIVRYVRFVIIFLLFYSKNVIDIALQSRPGFLAHPVYYVYVTGRSHLMSAETPLVARCPLASTLLQPQSVDFFSRFVTCAAHYSYSCKNLTV